MSRDDFVVVVRCGNCGHRETIHQLEAIGELARGLHEHWEYCHKGVNIHGPSVTVYEPRPAIKEND